MRRLLVTPLLLVTLLANGCVPAHKAGYEAPLYRMEVLDRPANANGWEIAEVSTQEIVDQRPGTRPALTSDEAGLWMAMDKAESEYATAGNLIQDKALTDYLQTMACRLAPDYCRDIRIYVLRVPYFNATMAPNGALVLWSGLLLRAENEAQVAAVIGHEIGHYLRRHSLQRMRGVVDTAGTMAVVQLATAAVGLGITGQLATLMAMGGLQAYNRDQEREADGYGLALMSRAGYDPHQAARLWEQVIREMEATKDKKFSSMLFDSHPPEKERLAAIDALAARISAKQGKLAVGSEPYAEALHPYRSAFLTDELNQRDFARLEVLLDQLSPAAPHSGELAYFKGEVYRLRGEEGDQEKALAVFETASKAPDCPTETFRAQGLIYQRLGRKSEARMAFGRYLAGKPDAMDREMIMHMLAKEER